MSAGNHALQRFLARLVSRSTLSVEEQRAILELPCRVTKAPARHDIVLPGEKVDHACLVGKGLVARFDQMRDGQRQIAAFHIAGDMCDLHSVVAPVAGWGISSLTSSTLLFVPHTSLRELAVRYPAIAMAFWRDGTADASILAKWVGNLGRQDARARLAHLLCEFGVRFEHAALGTRTCFTLDLTQEQMADALGLTAVHVNRTIQRLRGEGAITTLNRTVEVADWSQLVEIADFDPAYLLFHEPSASPHAAELATRAAAGEQFEGGESRTN